MAAPMMSTVKGIYKAVKPYEPEQFLHSSTDVSSSTLETLKKLYDFTKDTEVEAGDLQNLAFSSVSTSKSKRKRKIAAKAALTEAPLRQLITESFDSEQIWEEVQLQNGLMYENLVSSISRLLAHANTLQSQATEITAHQQAVKRSKQPPAQDSFGFDEEEVDSEYEFEGNSRKKPKSKLKSSKPTVYSKSQVDDKFFNLAQMTEFLEKVESQIDADDRRDKENEDVGSGSDSDESIDMFAALDEDEEDAAEGEEQEQDDRNIYYDQFFDRPLDEVQVPEQDSQRSEKVDQGEVSDDANADLDEEFEAEDEEDGDDLEVPEGSSQSNQILLEPADDSSSSDDDDPAELRPDSAAHDLPKNLSNFEKRRKKIDESINQIEEEALQPRGWQFQGEVTAEKRPENSLLEEHLVFDHLLRQAPEITVKATLKLEDVMKQRIKDQAWDDVERKAKPKDTPIEYKNKLILDSEKSKQSLAQVYEQEYINKKKAEDGQAEETIPEEEAAIQKGLKTLFAKLDALSNFHFTPKPAMSDIKIVTNLPSIAMEEVAPVSVSDAMLLAPQEIQAPIMAELKATGERDTTDKKRERRQKKKKQHLKRVDREERSRVKGLGLRNVKLAENILSSGKKGKKRKADEGVVASSDGKSKELKSSKAFFDKLQDKVQTQIKDKVAKSKKSEVKKSPQAKKFKL